MKGAIKTIIGLLVMIIGVYAIIWFRWDVWTVIKGFIGPVILLIGIVVFIIGINDFKS